MKEFKNEALEKAVELAKERGYRVYTFESSSKYITQIFYENEKGEIGSAQADYSGLMVMTVHKPGGGNGTGFVIKELATHHDIDLGFTFKPNWASGGTVKKYSSFEEYKNRDSILKYYEI